MKVETEEAAGFKAASLFRGKNLCVNGAVWDWGVFEDLMSLVETEREVQGSSDSEKEGEIRGAAKDYGRDTVAGASGLGFRGPFEPFANCARGTGA